MSELESGDVASRGTSADVAGDGFRDLARVDDLPPGAKLAFDVDGKSVLVCNAGGEIHAVENACTHAAIPLLSGRLRGCVLECPLHGGKFDLRDGKPVAGPPRRPLPRFEVRVASGRIAVRVAGGAAGGNATGANATPAGGSGAGPATS